MRFVTVLFVSVILFSVATIPSVASQTVTTITSILTTAGVFTSSSYSTAVVGSTTVTAQSTSILISNTVNTLQAYGHAYCNWDYWNLTVAPGTSEITGTIGPNNQAIGFYIMTQQQYNDFKNSVAGDCAGPWNGDVVVQSLTSAYALNWTNPPPGSYYVVFFNYGSSFPITTPFFLVATSTQEQTSTIYSVATAGVTVPTTETMTSIQVSQIAASSPLTSIPGFPWESLLVGFLIGLAILLLKRSRKIGGA